MTILGLDGIELDVWNDEIFMVDPLRYDSGVLLNMLVARLKFKEFKRMIIKETNYLADPDPSTAKEEAEEEAMLRNGKQKIVVKSDSENDGIIEDIDSDDSDASNKSFDYLSAEEEELIQSGVGRTVTDLGRSATLIDDEGVNGSANLHNDGGMNGIDVGGSTNPHDGGVNGIDVGGSANVCVGSASGVGGSIQGTGGSGIGRGVVRGCDIPGLKWSPPHKRALLW
ncbi:hypothetical protein Tco_1314459 [Tanacetum coccineum]